MKMRKKWTVAVITAAFVTGLVCGCANPQKAGVKALEKGEYQEAKEQFLEMTESGSSEDAAEGYRGLGMTYYEMEDYAGALEAFEQAVDKGVHQSAQLYNLMGICAMQTEDYEAALAHIQSGLALAGTSAGEEEQPSEELLREMKYNEIICYERLADWENARQKANEYLSEYPDDEAVQREAEFLETR